MREISSDITFEVEANQVASVRVSRSTRLTVRCGAVWVTRSDDTADYWLEPGHTLRLRRGERLWIGAEQGTAAWVAFATPSRIGERALDWAARQAARVGFHAGDGWRTV
ncbi:Protein of unknown function (DUF2917) [Paraburkholderia eburnea]|uniref:DUF2917 family protein n=1 Tax=Paraburkholderia eburnea TaxID=1189126 RepID=A0A2S4MNH9_9BURK|nr:DUF2917 domain-containing protein [Paraburkholderia eburnea]POR56300.1 Protein of unknown function (DUF2917) [Paraburkholderia eburnea]PRZ27427.1 Protein of unknown function (DUF2917) [Paraburkholderia eburnea]